MEWLCTTNLFFLHESFLVYKLNAQRARQIRTKSVDSKYYHKFKINILAPNHSKESQNITSSTHPIFTLCTLVTSLSFLFWRQLCCLLFLHECLLEVMLLALLVSTWLFCLHDCLLEVMLLACSMPILSAWECDVVLLEVMLLACWMPD